MPVIASGGAGTLEHFYEEAVNGGSDILLAASVFHFYLLSIRQVKEYLREKGADGKFVSVSLKIKHDNISDDFLMKW